MKKIIFPAVAGLLLFASCKKDYTCSCTNTQTNTNTTTGTATVGTSTSSTVYKDVKKSFVENKAECYEESYSYSYTDWQGDVINVDVNWNCEIQK